MLGYAGKMETTPRPNPYDATLPRFRPGERRPLRASAYWIIFAVATVLWLASSLLPAVVLAGSLERPHLALGLVTAVGVLCATVAAVALGLAIATGIKEDRIRLLAGISIAVAGAVATALWQMFIQAAGSIAQVTTLHLVGTFSTPLLCAGVVCVLAGLRARSR